MADVSLIAVQLQRAAPGGIGTYVRGLLQGLQAMGADAPPVTLVTGRGGGALGGLGFPVRASSLPSRALTRLWDHDLGFGAVGPADVIYAPSFATPFPRATPVVMTVHDLAWREVPDTFPERGREWHERALQRALQRAASIIVPSARTAERLAEALVVAGIAAVDVVVIPEGADHLPPADQDGAIALLETLGVTPPYVLSVSTLEPRKNLPRLVTAYGQARARLPEPWPLVVVGPSGWGPSLTASPGVKLAGMVTDPVLAALYGGARCLAYVPVVEGWGLPAVEAMTAGTPVVASPMPSTEGAALEVDPLDVEAIAEAIVVAASDDRRRSELVAAGLARARELTWEAAARRHVDVWSRV